LARCVIPQQQVYLQNNINEHNVAWCIMMSSNMEEWTLRSCHFRSYQTCLHSCTCLVVRSPFLNYDMCTFR
jgi:hypothetical protein